jgi:hypothetical protein
MWVGEDCVLRYVISKRAPCAKQLPDMLRCKSEHRKVALGFSFAKEHMSWKTIVRER